MLDRFPGKFQYFDSVMPVFPGTSGTFSDLARDQNASCANFPGIYGNFKDVDSTLSCAMPKFPKNSWEIHGCLTDFLGSSSILIAQCQFFLGFSGTFSDLARDQNASCANFLGIHGTFKDVGRTLNCAMPKFLRNSWEIHGCSTDFLGNSSTLIP